MVKDVKDVILHVYKLAPENNAFISQFLPAIGFGAYHSCVEIDGYRYTFAANAGIQKTPSFDTSTNGGLLPGGAQFEESIRLGVIQFNQSEIDSIVRKLEDQYFGTTSYHLVYRNCNHFSETFATTLIMPDKLLEENECWGGENYLKTFPSHVNRLANMSRGILQVTVEKDQNDITPCVVKEEARFVICDRDNVGWNAMTKQNNFTVVKNRQKKELTEKQKVILRKIRGCK
mmetsp:Transcript_7697/g.8489  ORF Transcript_7697/g.8489 Transcript_7697/m.8489 type:complete len:231 (+) Transcript_7697:90-782(+)|eukprot:CAMPEP_0194145344 /NCGR_PEP_ID=MMETSP0152-20130528/16977_1 /TAXON_ID=1049557 /ORGANISM="Thalassiothrix antarctica, Strain L6-D1" /LENGTH=230 /DNA_ID=CAMNT_0038845545 /DNA_START=25 /DNA_END=717 /DNA_ORIENTATION=+